jgi:hypothetical protein
MAASLGLVGHETYPPPTASVRFPPGDLAPTMKFPPPATPTDDYFLSELGVQPPPEYYATPRQIFAENEMNM